MFGQHSIFIYVWPAHIAIVCYAVPNTRIWGTGQNLHYQPYQLDNPNIYGTEEEDEVVAVGIGPIMVDLYEGSQIVMDKDSQLLSSS